VNYYIIVSNIENSTRVEGFYIEHEIEHAMDELDRQTIKYLGVDCHPLENGTIGFYSSSGDRVYLEEKDTQLKGVLL